MVQRPKVLYNRQTRKFVMWFHLDLPRGTVERHDGTYYQNAQSLCDKAGAPCAKLMGYQLRSVGVATADRPEGPYVWERGARLPPSRRASFSETRSRVAQASARTARAPWT